MSNRNLISLALVLLLPASFARAAEPTISDVIAAQGNVALQQIRSEVARSLPGRLKAQIALPPRANGYYADDAGAGQGAGLLYVEVDVTRSANES